MAENENEEVIWSETDNENADWIKSLSWDLPTEPEEFLRSLGGTSIEDFLKLPAAKAMPAELLNELIKSGHIKPKGV
jgi:hypothetical protein